MGVYGPNLRLEVSDFLQEFDDIKALWNLPLWIGGYFNLIRFSKEMSGGVVREMRAWINLRRLLIDGV